MFFKTIKAVFKNSDEKVEIYAKFLTKITIFTLIIGVILGLIIWFISSSSVGEDIAALIWCITFTISVAVMSIKEMLLSNKEASCSIKE